MVERRRHQLARQLPGAASAPAGGGHLGLDELHSVGHRLSVGGPHLLPHPRVAQRREQGDALGG